MDESASTTVSILERPGRRVVAPDSRSALPLSDRVLQLADRHRYKLFGILLVWYALGFNGQWRLEPDSALYLTIGRNLAEGHGYTYHGQPHRLAFPGPPLLFAAGFRLTGEQHLVPMLAVMLLLGFLTLALTYRLFLLYAGRPTAVLMTFGLGISRLFYRYCFELLSDLPFLLGAMAFLVGYEAVFYRRPNPGNDDPGDRSGARWFDWALLVGGLLVAVIMRPTMWALLAAAGLATGWSLLRPRRTGQLAKANAKHPVQSNDELTFHECPIDSDRVRTRWPQIAVVCVIVAAVVAFSLIDPRHAGGHTMGQYEDALFEAKFSHLGTMLRQSFTEYLPLLFESAVCKAVLGCPIGFVLNSIAGAVFIGLGIALVRVRPLWGLWVAMTVAIVLVAVKPLDRYFLEVLPLLIYAWWWGIRWLNLHLRDRWGLSQRWADRIFLMLFVLGGTTNVLRTGEFIFEQRHAHFRSYYKEGRYASADQVARLIRDHVAPRDWVLAPSKCGRILTFLSHRNVTEAPGEAQLDPRRQRVFILDPFSDAAREWLASKSVRLGPQIGPTVEGARDSDKWRLYLLEPGT